MSSGPVLRFVSLIEAQLLRPSALVLSLFSDQLGVLS